MVNTTNTTWYQDKNAKPVSIPEKASDKGSFYK